MANAKPDRVVHRHGLDLGGGEEANLQRLIARRQLPADQTAGEADRELLANLAIAVLDRYRALVLLGAYAGLRIGELAGLRRRRVDLRGTVDVAEASCTWGHPRPGPVGAS
jgi:integrase